MKIVQAVNAMIANRDKISDVQKGLASSKEFFFLYDGKYKWSILESATGQKDAYRLFFYPGDQSLRSLATMNDFDWQEFGQLVGYSTEDLGTREAKSSFEDLYRIVRESESGIDKVLDDIIGDLPF